MIFALTCSWQREDALMTGKPMHKELEQKVKDLEKEAAERKQAEEAQDEGQKRKP